jgi:hypothetical protein
MSDNVPNYGEVITNAAGAEAQAVLAFMTDVRQMNALSTVLEKINPALARAIAGQWTMGAVD